MTMKAILIEQCECLVCFLKLSYFLLLVYSPQELEIYIFTNRCFWSGHLFVLAYVPGDCKVQEQGSSKILVCTVPFHSTLCLCN